SIICVLLSLTGLILGCQGILFVSSVPRCDWVDTGEDKICLCCKEINLTKCTEEETLLKLYHLKSCSAAHFLLKKVLFAVCALNAITTIVCLVAAALPFLRSFATRRSCRGVPRVEDEDDVLDLDDFVPPVPPPSYFETLYSSALEMSHRMLASDVIPLPHIYRARIKGIKVFCPLDPPPPYEVQISVEEDVGLEEMSAGQASQVSADLCYYTCFSFIFTIANHSGEEVPEPSSRVSLSPSDGSQMPAEGACVPVFNPLQKRSESEPVLHCRLLQGVVLSSEPAIQTEVKASLCGVTLRKSLTRRDLRERAQSLVDYRSYKDTKQLVAWILEQSSCSMNPDIHEVVGSIKSVLKSDEKRMAEAISSATFLEQVMAPAQQARVLPFRQYSGLLHLETCGDLSISTTDEDWLAERRIQRECERPHSHIGIVRETAL
ncbi:Protein FAM189A2, partial [Merops nubicus]